MRPHLLGGRPGARDPGLQQELLKQPPNPAWLVQMTPLAADDSWGLRAQPNPLHPASPALENPLQALVS